MAIDIIQEFEDSLRPDRASMTETEVKQVIKVRGTDKNGVLLADETLRRLPSYPAGSQRRYWSSAVDKYLSEHNIP